MESKFLNLNSKIRQYMCIIACWLIDGDKNFGYSFLLNVYILFQNWHTNLYVTYTANAF